ncbi:MAG: CoB--CoM heterodisulfide reductase iron-sulfur subunit B family protein [Deltaproteobacteria bacterium]|mgnify:CR=1 FL=1|nr:CoB--CoM heterodisulfide reductase iron-sulfur subunit B family protein [Deltaproteobacteria bacterium]MBW1928178.1 CoB--CoM heterodisulfide reductase iron-sulfur subunit B family protein [Deltaproteobacteria bacterium]MBW2025423.1 CoB--CoM heterodisulfide reductase iron-sulfur subunit B family protein [Deltaproteobacteria bacterium]RLB19307.1 MAG: CoB--CoM heterodisulfide reductase subunit B [Deltaproteobacteria bacterium]
MRYALFLGCTIPARSRNYEMSARAVAEKLGIELLDIEDFSCCGFPLKSSDRASAELLAARNLALAEERGVPIVTLCSSCNSMLAETAHHLSHSDEDLHLVNEQLQKVGREYKGNTTVKHFARVLLEDVGIDRIKENLVQDLNGIPIATHYGCHYIKPTEIYPGGENPDHPDSLDQLLEAVGARAVTHGMERDCCGGPVLVTDEQTALAMAKQKLDKVKASGAKAMTLVCPFCSVMYDDNQKSIEAQFDVSYQIPVLYLPQVIGLALGLDRKVLGLNLNVVKTKAFTEQILSEQG